MKKLFLICLLIRALIFASPLKASDFSYGGANSLSLGLTHRCFNGTEDDLCFVGQKLTIEHSFLSKSKSQAPEYRPINTNGMGSWHGGYYSFGDGRALLALVLIYLFIFVFVVYVLPGAVWILGSLYSNYIESGIYASSLLLSRGQGSGINSIGMKVSAYPFEDVDFSFYLGAAYSFTSWTSDRAEGNSMLFGFGLVPKKTGFMASIEFERHFLNEKIKNIHAKEILEDSKNLGQSSLVLGWRF